MISEVPVSVMTSRLAQLGHFLKLLLTTDKRQKAALISTLTHEQTDLLGEIFHNLTKVLPLNSQQEKKLRRKPFLRLLANTKTSPGRRKALIKRHSKQIADILSFFGEQLLEVVRLSV